MILGHFHFWLIYLILLLNDIVITFAHHLFIFVLNWFFKIQPNHFFISKSQTPQIFTYNYTWKSIEDINYLCTVKSLYIHTTARDICCPFKDLLLLTENLNTYHSIIRLLLYLGLQSSSFSWTFFLPQRLWTWDSST